MIARINFARKVRCHSGTVEIIKGAAFPFRREGERMDHPLEGGAKGLEDRVKPPARPGSVVPSFAKPAKLGQPLSPMCGQETLRMGQPPI